MKVRVELIDDGSEDEIIIRCGRVDDTVHKIHQYIKDLSEQNLQIDLYKDNEEFYFSVEDILFFETEQESVYAHTIQDSYLIKHRLYELEKMLPGYFIRSSKSTIINSKQVYSITRNLTASSLVTFKNTHKRVYVSRNYYSQLRQLLRKEYIK
ncbi:MAG: LytTR family transcriptional regulator [Clostridiales bacterium]|nr:MAG: LytTR family transcriptional regulator [Clostridiales bacterium]